MQLKKDNKADFSKLTAVHSKACRNLSGKVREYINQAVTNE